MAKKGKPGMSLLDPTGWEQADLETPDLVRYGRLARVLKPLSRYFRTRIDHVERIPEGGALLVGNHSTWGIDSFALIPALFEQTHRPVRGLAEKMLFANALGRRIFHSAGAVPGTRKVAVELLERGELCLCYPGGDHDSFKRWWERHTLKWTGRTGYVRVALLSGAPIVPILGVGIDDAFPVLTQDRVMSRRIFGSSRYDLPIFLTGAGVSAFTGPIALPIPVQFRFEVGPPIYLEATAEQKAAILRGDPEIESFVAAHHADVWARCQTLLDDLVARHDSPTRGRLASRLATWLG